MNRSERIEALAKIKQALREHTQKAVVQPDCSGAEIRDLGRAIEQINDIRSTLILELQRDAK